MFPALFKVSTAPQPPSSSFHPPIIIPSIRQSITQRNSKNYYLGPQRPIGSQRCATSHQQNGDAVILAMLRFRAVKSRPSRTKACLAPTIPLSVPCGVIGAAAIPERVLRHVWKLYKQTIMYGIA